MKRFLKITAIIIILLGVAGYAVWHFGTKIASEKILEKVESNLDDAKLEEVKAYIKNDPKVQEILSEGANANPENLPFQTKEEATKVLIKKVGVNRLLDMKEQAQNGSISKDEVLAEFEGKLSDDEMTALKYVLYKELSD